EAENYETARDLLGSKNFDIVVLDLKIPAGDEPPSEKWSRRLLTDILKGRFCFPIHVFGLTEHKDILQSERAYYEANLFGLYIFDWNEEEWAKAICAKMAYLAQAMATGAAYRLNSFDYD